MGLDMYLEKHTYVQQWDHIPDDEQYVVNVTRGGKPYPAIHPERVSYVIEYVAYWRKANQIHAWFVEHVQQGEDDCDRYDVTDEQLKGLLTTVNHAIEVYHNAKRQSERDALAEILPTESGFFFGSTEYDNNYLCDLEETRDMLTPLVAEMPTPYGAYYYYRASW